MSCINGKANAVFSVDLGNTGVVNTADLVIVNFEAWFGCYFEMNTVIGISNAEIRAFELLFFVIAVVITEDHDIFTVFSFQNTCVKSESGFIGNVFIC